MSTRSVSVLLGIALLLIINNASSRAAGDIDWKGYGALLARNLPENVKNGTDVDRAHYITAQIARKLIELGVPVNATRIDRGLGGGNTLGTCADVSNKLSAALTGAGLASNTVLISRKDMAWYNRIGRALSDPFDVNQAHAGVVMVLDGKVYVSDLWIHGVSKGKSFAGMSDSEWNCMDINEYQKRLKAAHYATFSTEEREGEEFKTILEALVRNGILLEETPLTTLAAGGTWEGNVVVRKSLEITANISWHEAAGAAFCLELEVNGKRVSAPLTNKPMSFTYADKRTYPYYGPEYGAWMLFYSPDFATNNSKKGGRYQVIGGNAYVYRWNMAALCRPGDIAARVVLRHNGKAANNKPIKFILRAKN